MKKILLLCFLFCMMLKAFADQCPHANRVVTCDQQKDCVVHPISGWRLLNASNIHGEVFFDSAMWGYHRDLSNPVRCVYYTKDTYGTVDIVSEKTYTLSQVEYHENWSDLDDYFLCRADYKEVGECRFG